MICGEYSKYNLVYICIGWNDRAGIHTPKSVCSWYQSFAMETKSDTSKVSDEHVKNQISPYCLSASDNPGNIITQVQLKGDNYDEWARAIRTALRAKKKFGFVDGRMKEPAKEPELDDWWTINSIIVS